MWNELARIIGAPLVAGIAAAVATNYFSARFSLARFRKEQWWTEKREAYHAIIRKLCDISFRAEAEMESIETGGMGKAPDSPKREKDVAWSLQEIVSSGAYIVSEKTVSAVKECLKEMANSDARSKGNFYGILEIDYSATQKAIATVRAEAHKDLGV